MAFVYPAWLLPPLAFIGLLLASCASPQSLEHPQGWGSSPETLLPNGCPDLSGTYSTRATEAYPPYLGVFPTLSEILGSSLLHDAQGRNRPWPAVAGATTATFTSDGDWMHVRFRDDVEGEGALSFKKKHWWGGSVEGSDAMYQCLELEQGRALGFDGPRGQIISVPYLFSEGDVAFVFLSKARDGSLIVNYRTDRIFITGILIGSHARWVGSIWWRYPPVVTDR
jgi:hypothetical protein